ncbi:hypothetical protein [Corynebacterium flavescens]|uniref:hypothetical protein n=1 Tax=Corynebacterium flavescens TaxID=28028 RepID=UPI00289C6180|nr:hypothetical protein [Corynebacterium flavescens]
MTSPDRFQPQQPGRLEDIKPKIEGLAGIMLSNVGLIAQNVFEAINDALAGLFAGQSGALGQISDGQLALMNELGLLAGLRGFCSAYQSVNVNAEWSLSGNNRVLPFDEPLTAWKGAHIDKSKPGIVFEEEGAWLVSCYARARETAFTGADEVGLFVDVFRPDGTLFSPMVFDARPGGGYSTVGGTFPVLIPEPGCYVRVSCWTGRWRWWDGGPRYARLSVVKQDNRVIANVQPDVPDEVQPQNGDTK